MPVYNPPTYREQCTKVVGFDAATCDYLCDGTADEVQINAAIAAVVVLGGGCVALQRGTYDIRASIVMDNEVWLHGSGFDTVLLRSTANFDMITATNKINMIISDFYLDGASSATCGIYFSGCTYSIIQRVYVTRSGDEGIQLTSNSHYNHILDCIVTLCGDQGIYVGTGSYNIIIGNYVYICGQGIYISGTRCLANSNICYTCGEGIRLAGVDGICVGNQIIGSTSSTDIYIGAARCTAAGNYCSYNLSATQSFRVAGANSAVISNVVYQPACSGISVEANDCSVVGNSVADCKFAGVTLENVSRCSIVGNHIDSPDSASANSYDGVLLNACNDCTIVGNSITNNHSHNVRDGIRLLGFGGSSDNVITSNRIRGYDCAIDITAAACARNLVKENQMYPTVLCIIDLGTDTRLASVIVPFVSGYDPQDSGFLVDGEEDFALTWTMLPVEVQKVVRAKVYARSGVAETHSMEADFTIYGAADNEAYTTHNGSAASLGCTSVNFAADDVIYWTLTNAGILALLGKDSIQVKVDGAAADGDNCATNAYFRTVEIEYV